MVAASIMTVVLAAGVAVPAFAGTDPQPHIVGGHQPSQPYPAMASLQINHNGDPNFHICGAVLVSRRWLVTNAHCVTAPGNPTAEPAGMFHLRLGSPDRTAGGVLATVDKVVVHANWNWANSPGPVADIAMLELSSFVQLQPFEVAAVLHHTATMRVLGWGMTEPAPQPPLPTDLQELDTRLLPPDRCLDGGITAGEICLANPHGTDGPCFGDSGGPALQRIAGTSRWADAGGASRETSEVGCGIAPTIYTDLTFYRPWMYQVMLTGTAPPRTSDAPSANDSGDLAVARARFAQWTQYLTPPVQSGV